MNMTNGTKIKTMKDDLLEIESKLSQSPKTPAQQQKTPAPAASTAIIQPPKTGTVFSVPKKPAPTEDLKTKELRNIVDRLSKNKSAPAVSTGVSKPQSAAQTTVAPKTTAGDKDDLRALIERISKREGEAEKPLAKPAEPIKETPAVGPTIEIKPQIEDKPKIKTEMKVQAKPEIPVPETEAEPVMEKPDLDKLIKPIEKPQLVKEISKDPSVKKTVPEIKAFAVPTGKPAIPEEEIEIEKKEEEIKEILGNITKKESELKDLLEKISRKKGLEEKTPQPEPNIPQKIDIQKPIMPGQIASARPEPSKLIKAITKPAPKKIINAPTITPIRPLPKPLSVSKTEITGKGQGIELAPELKPIQTIVKKKESPIMKKVRERLFGMEKTGLTEKITEKTQAETKPVTEEKILKSPISPETSKAEDRSYFKKIADSKQAIEPKLEKVEEKFSNLQSAAQTSEVKPEKVKEFESSSGIIKTNSQEGTKREEELAKARRSYIDSQYVSPTSRLVFGKQEHYSSIRKHIEERHLDADLKELESKVAKNENVILSEKEEKKKLKQRIMSKYHIKSPSTLRNIFVVAVIIIAIAGGGLYTYLSRIDVTPPEVVVPPVPGKQLASLSTISDSIEITTEDLQNPIILREEIAKKFSTDLNLRFFKLIIKDEKVNYVKLNSALDSINIKTELLPQAFLEQTEDEYSILVFKTQKNTARLALAIKLKPNNTMSDIMMNWEKDRTKLKDTLSPIFVSDRSSDIQNSYFQNGYYKDVNIRYVSLPDKDTAIDYFIHDSTLVIATTKDDTFRLIDILTSAK